MHADDDDLEARLKDALATYAEPDSSPAPRLVAVRVIAAAQERRLARRWRAYAGLVSGLACLLLIVLVARVHQRFAPVAIESAAAQQASRPNSQVQPTVLAARSQAVSARRHQESRVEAKVDGAPRLDQFPTPAPLTDEEKLMLAFVTSASPATQQFIARAVEPPLSIRIAEEQPLSDNAGALETAAPKTSKSGALHEEHR